MLNFLFAICLKIFATLKALKRKQILTKVKSLLIGFKRSFAFADKEMLKNFDA